MQAKVSGRRERQVMRSPVLTWDLESFENYVQTWSQPNMKSGIMLGSGQYFNQRLHLSTCLSCPETETTWEPWGRDGNLRPVCCALARCVVASMSWISMGRGPGWNRVKQSRELRGSQHEKHPTAPLHRDVGGGHSSCVAGGNTPYGQAIQHYRFQIHCSTVQTSFSYILFNTLIWHAQIAHCA